MWLDVTHCVVGVKMIWREIDVILKCSTNLLTHNLPMIRAKINRRKKKRKYIWISIDQS